MGEGDLRIVVEEPIGVNGPPKECGRRSRSPREQKRSEKEVAFEEKATEESLKKAEANAAQLLKKKFVQGEDLKHLRSLAEKLLKKGQ